MLLDGVYLAGSSQLGIKQWHDFFSQLGVTDFLSVKPVSVHLTKTDMVSWCGKSIRSTGLSDQSHMVDPLSYFSF